MSHLLVQLSVDDAIEFYETCIKLEIADDDIEAKNAVLFEIVSHQKEPHVWSTNRSKEEILADLKRNYGEVLDMTKGKKDERD